MNFSVEEYVNHGSKSGVGFYVSMFESMDPRLLARVATSEKPEDMDLEVYETLRKEMILAFTLEVLDSDSTQGYFPHDVGIREINVGEAGATINALVTEIINPDTFTAQEITEQTLELLRRLQGNSE